MKVTGGHSSGGCYHRSTVDIVTVCSMPFVSCMSGIDKRRVMWRRVMGELRLDQVASNG